MALALNAENYGCFLDPSPINETLVVGCGIDRAWLYSKEQLTDVTDLEYTLATADPYSPRYVLTLAKMRARKALEPYSDLRKSWGHNWQFIAGSRMPMPTQRRDTQRSKKIRELLDRTSPIGRGPMNDDSPRADPDLSNRLNAEIREFHPAALQNERIGDWVESTTRARHPVRRLPSKYVLRTAEDKEEAIAYFTQMAKDNNGMTRDLSALTDTAGEYSRIGSIGDSSEERSQERYKQTIRKEDAKPHRMVTRSMNVVPTANPPNEDVQLDALDKMDDMIDLEESNKSTLSSSYLWFEAEVTEIGCESHIDPEVRDTPMTDWDMSLPAGMPDWYMNADDFKYPLELGNVGVQRQGTSQPSEEPKSKVNRNPVVLEESERRDEHASDFGQDAQTQFQSQISTVSSSSPNGEVCGEIVREAQSDEAAASGATSVHGAGGSRLSVLTGSFDTSEAVQDPNEVQDDQLAAKCTVTLANKYAENIPPRHKRPLDTLPVELLSNIISNLEILSIDTLGKTNRFFRDMVDDLNLDRHVDNSHDDPLCFPYPHGIIGACSSSFADWMEGNKIDGGHSRYDHWSSEERYQSACDVIEKHGNFGLAMLMVDVVGVKLPQLREFQSQMRRHCIAWFPMNRRTDGFHEFHSGLQPLMNGILRRTAIANEMIYTRLFGRVIDNVMKIDWHRKTPVLGWELRRDWFRYCLPSPEKKTYPRNLWQYQAIDHGMLVSLLNCPVVKEWHQAISNTLEVKILIGSLYAGLGIDPRSNEMAGKCRDHLMFYARSSTFLCLPLIPKRKTLAAPRGEWTHEDLVWVLQALHPYWYEMPEVVRNMWLCRITIPTTMKPCPSEDDLKHGKWNGFEWDLIRTEFS